MNLENLDTVIGFVVVVLLLSMLITSAVQLVGMLLRLREKTLLWGIGRVLQQLAPGIDVAPLARLVAGHDSINPTGKGSATAIHFDEFIGIVKKIVADAKDQTLAMTYKDLLAAIDAAPTQELTAMAATLEGELSKVFPQDAARVKEAAARAKAAALEAGGKVRFWFDTVMDRTTERFVAHTRIITIVVAVAFAFGARIDSLDLLKQLSQKADVRAKLVQMADPVMKEAGAVLHPATAAAAGAGAQDVPPLPGALAAIKASHPADVPADLTGPDSADQATWETAIAARLPADKKDGVLADFRTELAKREVVWLAAHVKTLQGDLAQTSLQILPAAPYTLDFFTQRRVLGILMSAFFLSLGAPFWFNALRQLSNLRPILAGKVEAKDTAETG